MAQDNLATQYDAEEICGNMARPETTHFARIKKLAQSMLREMVNQTSLSASIDSLSAELASTRGLGRMRHLEVQDMWIQALVKDGRVTLRKTPGSYIVSDVLTKYSYIACRARLLGLAGIRIVPVEDIDLAGREVC